MAQWVNLDEQVWVGTHGEYEQYNIDIGTIKEIPCGGKNYRQTQEPQPIATDNTISRQEAKQKAKEIIYGLLDNVDCNDAKDMAAACILMKIRLIKMFDELPPAQILSKENA